jgi:hypothetical protein
MSKSRQVKHARLVRHARRSVDFARSMEEQYEQGVQTKVVTNLMSGNLVRIPVDTPLCCDPSSETYWSM